MVLPCPLWLRYLLEIFDSIQQGLCNAQQHSPEGSDSAFLGLSGNEAWVIHKISCIIENLDNFFEFGSDEDHLHVHCLCCVYLACLPLPEGSPALLQALNLTVAHDSEAYHTSLLNNMVHKVQEEAEVWASQAQTNLRKFIVQALISSSPDLSEAAQELADDLNPDLMAWVKNFRADIQDHAKCLISEEAVAQIFDPIADKVLTCELASHHATAQAEVNCQVYDFQAEYHQCQKMNAQIAIDTEIALDMQQYKAATLTHETALVDAKVALELQSYKHNAKVQASMHHQEINDQLCTSVVCTPKPACPSPISSKPPHKHKVRVSKPGLDPSQPIFIHDSLTPASDAGSLESDVDSVMDDSVTPHVSPVETAPPLGPPVALAGPVSSALNSRSETVWSQQDLLPTGAVSLGPSTSGAQASSSDPLLLLVLQNIQPSVQALEFQLRTLECKGSKPLAPPPPPA